MKAKKKSKCPNCFKKWRDSNYIFKEGNFLFFSCPTWKKAWSTLYVRKNRPRLGLSFYKRWALTGVGKRLRSWRSNWKNNDVKNDEKWHQILHFFSEQSIQSEKLHLEAITQLQEQLKLAQTSSEHNAQLVRERDRNERLERELAEAEERLEEAHEVAEQEFK